MKDLAIRILTAKADKTHLFFLGQAGFVVKSKKGTLLVIDAYLSNCVERYDGFKRLLPSLLSADEIEFDYILATHPHYDHFDIDAIPIMLSNDVSKLFASTDCKKEIEQLGIDEGKVTYISYGNSYKAGDIHIDCVFCDHGESAPDAVGLIVTVDDKKLYFAGDTCLRPDKIPEIKSYGKIDIMIAAINGAFGNLNEADMVALCGEISPGLVIPCHFWNFAEHHGDPGLFLKLIKEKLPDQRYLLMAPGEALGL
jgi:L-ascorbate 6-phosphate lactonase